MMEWGKGRRKRPEPLLTPFYPGGPDRRGSARSTGRVFVRQRCSLSSAVDTYAYSKFIYAHCRMQIMWFPLFWIHHAALCEASETSGGFARSYATQQRNKGLFWTEHWEKCCGRVGKSIEFNRKIVTIVWQTCAKCQSRNDFHPELIAFYCIITSLIFAASTLCVVFIVLRRACYSPTWI